MAELTVGQAAPDFTAQINGGKTLTLSSLKGKNVVLYFYPKDNTSGCTKQACGFRDAIEDFSGIDATIIGVSPDSVASHDKFIAKHELPFTLVSDEDKSVCELYGVWKEKSMYGRKYMGVERSTFIIDKAGNIHEIMRKVRVKDHIEKVHNIIQSLEESSSE